MYETSLLLIKMNKQKLQNARSCNFKREVIHRVVRVESISKILDILSILTVPCEWTENYLAPSQVIWNFSVFEV